MIKVLFVCLGNICRSPMAEYMFKDLVKKRNIDNKFIVESRATSSEEVGNDMDIRAKRKLSENNIPINKHTAKKITIDDYNNFDYIIGMEKSNITNILRIIKEDKDRKVYRLLDFTDKKKDIDDPWYTNNFDITYNELKEGLNSFLDYLIEKGEV